MKFIRKWWNPRIPRSEGEYMAAVENAGVIEREDIKNIPTSEIVIYLKHILSEELFDLISELSIRDPLEESEYFRCINTKD